MKRPEAEGGHGRGTAVRALRQFNRSYTNRLGLLSRYRFDTKLTLTEARVIFEIGRGGEHTQSALGRDLKIDMGYMNRVTRSLAARGMVSIRRHERDNRVSLLALTGAGRAALDRINAASDAQAEEMLRGLDDGQTRSLVSHLEAVEELLRKDGSSRFRIERAEGPEDIAEARILMKEYAELLGADLSFQGFEKELAGLPGEVRAAFRRAFSGAGIPGPRGVHRAPGVHRPPGSGCVALRRLSPGSVR